ncbi:unnamed protein product [Porites lobata]|uniref:MADF domain-containing protein n=1 Tax=Porites lobata TaxID=104759 RepID=A0ABN8P8U8_9CNID|nr:unnamed protein product [Porites lobata]
MTSKRELFIWKKHHDLLLLKEVVLEEPFKHNNGSKEKGTSWSKIADALTQHGMKVTQRSVRERFDKLYSDFKEREREEKQASGIDVEYDDNHKALAEIHERVLELEEERQDKETQEKATAAEMRKRATERLSVKKRRSKDDATVSDEPEEEVSPKRRMTGTVKYLMMPSIHVQENGRKMSPTCAHVTLKAGNQFECCVGQYFQRDCSPLPNGSWWKPSRGTILEDICNRNRGEAFSHSVSEENTSRGLVTRQISAANIAFIISSSQAIVN